MIEPELIIKENERTTLDHLSFTSSILTYPSSVTELRRYTNPYTLAGKEQEQKQSAWLFGVPGSNLFTYE